MKKDCSEVTLFDFMRCLFHSEYKYLLHDMATYRHELLEDLQERWKMINEEYSQLTDNPTYSKLMTQMEELLQMQKTYLHAKAAIVVLSYRYDVEQIKILKLLGFPGTFPEDNREQFDKELEVCSKRLKGIIVKLTDAIKRIDEAKQVESRPMTEPEFIRGVGIVSKSMGFRIPLKETTLLEWAGYLKLNNEIANKSRNNGE